MHYKNYYNYYVYVLIISILYSYLQNIGFYGFSNDYYNSYTYKFLSEHYDIQHRLGAIIASFYIGETQVGVGITSFFLALSTGLLLISFFKIKSFQSVSIFLFLYINILHIHPIIMSTSGAMRQGLLMSCIFISLFFINNKKKFLSFFFIILGILMHKAGIVFFTIYLLTIILKKLLKIFSKRSISLILNILIIFLVPFLIFLFNFFNYRPELAIIGSDLRYIWLLINIFLIAYVIIFYQKINLDYLKFIALFLFVHSIFALSMLFVGFSWEYERFNMIVAIILILFVGSVFTKISSYLFYSLSFLMYLFLTIYLGMYSVGLY